MKGIQILFAEWGLLLSQGVLGSVVHLVKQNANTSLLRLDNHVFYVGAGKSCYIKIGARHKNVVLCLAPESEKSIDSSSEPSPSPSNPHLNESR